MRATARSSLLHRRFRELAQDAAAAPLSVGRAVGLPAGVIDGQDQTVPFEVLRTGVWAHWPQAGSACRTVPFHPSSPPVVGLVRVEVPAAQDLVGVVERVEDGALARAVRAKEKAARTCGAFDHDQPINRACSKGRTQGLSSITGSVDGLGTAGYLPVLELFTSISSWSASSVATSDGHPYASATASSSSIWASSSHWGRTL